MFTPHSVTMKKTIFDQFFVLYLLLRSCGMFPYCIHKSKNKVKFVLRKLDVVLSCISVSIIHGFELWTGMMCMNYKDLLFSLQVFGVHVSFIVLYINCYRLLKLLKTFPEQIYEMDLKLNISNMKNRMYQVYAALSTLLYVFGVAEDAYHIVVQNEYVLVACAARMQLPRLIYKIQGVNYVFGMSVLKDRLRYLEDSIENEDFLKNLKSLKSIFAQLNKYYETTCFLKLANTSYDLLMNMNRILHYEDKTYQDSDKMASAMCWIVLSSLEICLFFYCIQSFNEVVC